jgi:FkbM family methyltransferase
MRTIELYRRLNQLINRVGFDLRRFPTRDQRLLIKYLKDNNVDDCFDVGANTGQYAKLFRSAGFKGKIFSFEPQKKVFEQLSKNAAHDDLWKVFNIGLGNANEKCVMNISENSVSSSILDISDILIKAAPETNYISTEIIQVNRIDTIIKEEAHKRRIFLKVDAQGFESKILEGAEGCFNDVFALQLELACVSLYKEEKLFDEVKAFVESKGFYLSSLESGFTDPDNGRLLQVEAIFLREVKKIL